MQGSIVLPPSRMVPRHRVFTVFEGMRTGWSESSESFPGKQKAQGIGKSKGKRYHGYIIPLEMSGKIFFINSVLK